MNGCLKARFNDAKFFWEVDQKKKLADRVEDLSHVTFQAKLGSYLEKTNRVVALVKELGGDEHAQRAAWLSKADLTTEMVKEFTDLQGIVGGLYAKAQGEEKAVCDAIYEHYKPLSMEDSIPSTKAGQILAIADKLDNLREFFRIDMVPTGSKDPFALRRAAQGIVKILVESKLPYSLKSLMDNDFMRERIQYYFREIQGFKYDEVNAVMAVGVTTLADVEDRLKKIAAVRSSPDFEPLAASFKRINNILRQANFTPGVLDPSLLEAGPEKELYNAFSEKDFSNLEGIAQLRPAVDRFFDKIMVNVPDERLRANRSDFTTQPLNQVFHDRRLFGDRYFRRPKMKKYVYNFGGGTADGDGKMKEVLGGKGAGLAEMSKAGVPVPPGFTISTEVCNIYFQNGNKVPDEINDQVLKGLAKLEKEIGKKLGDPKNPLLVSVRSGAKFSMPGMMNTILNLGLNDETTEGLAKLTNNPRFAYDSYRRFIQMFGEVALDIHMEKFDDIFDARKHKAKVKSDTDLIG